MSKTIIYAIFIIAVPFCSFAGYYITSLLTVIDALKLTVIALEKRCAVLEVAKQASENVSATLNTQLKITEVASVSTASSSLSGYWVVGGVFVIVCFCAYFSMSGEALAKTIAKTTVEHSSQNAAKVTELITHDVVTALVEPAGVLRTCLSTQESQLSTVSSLLTKGLEHNLAAISSKLDIISVRSESILGLLELLVDDNSPVAMPDLNQVGLGADILSSIAIVN